MFGWDSLLFAGIVGLVLGICLTARYRLPGNLDNDFESWRDGFSAGFSQGCLIGPPRFIGEDDNETEPTISAGS